MPTERDISEEILEYLRSHPEASDTLEGIAEWWLLNQKISHEMVRVKAAISKLVKNGWAIEVKRNSTLCYRFNPSKQKNIESRKG